jgi:flavorubredoxin
VGAVFGSFGWSGEAVEIVETRLKGLQYQLPVEGFKWRFNPTEDEQKNCSEFGKKFAEALLSQAEGD